MKTLTTPKSLPLSHVYEVIKAEKESKNIEQLIYKIENKLTNGNFRYNDVHKYISLETTDYYDNDSLDEMINMYEKAGWNRVSVGRKNNKITINLYYKNEA